MQLIENLKKIGLPEETINYYIKEGLMVNNGLGSYEIVNGDLMVSLIKKCTEFKINPSFLLVPVENNVKDELDILCTNLVNDNYMMAYEAAKAIDKKMHTKSLELFMNTCKSYPDYNQYIVNLEDHGNDPVTVEGLHSLERELLYELESFDFMSAIDTANLLINIYQDSNPIFCDNLRNLLRIFSEMSQDNRLIGNYSEEILVGPSDFVLGGLLDSNDIYRADTIINNQLKENIYSIEWQIYFTLMFQIKTLNEKNMKKAIARTVADASLDINNTWAFPETPFPKITKEDMLRIKNGSETEVDDTDYYSEYESALFEDCDLDRAKEALEKYQKQSILSYDNDDYDYLFDEIKILKENKELGVDLRKYNSALQFAMNYSEIGKYELAKNYAAKCYNLLQVKNPRVLCILGHIYYKTGDLKQAYYFYNEVINDSVAPDSLIEMAEVFYLSGEYRKALYAVNKYDSYEPMQNARIHYIAAASYLKLKKYDDSRSELDVCTTILSADDGLAIEFEDEREIIDSCEKGKEKSFELDDYVDYELTDDEFVIAQYLDENVAHANNILDNINKDPKEYTNNLKYLLSVTKVLFQSYDFDRGVEFCNKIDKVFDTKLLSKEDAKVMKKMINNLKRL